MVSDRLLMQLNKRDADFVQGSHRESDIDRGREIQMRMHVPSRHLEDEIWNEAERVTRLNDDLS